MKYKIVILLILNNPFNLTKFLSIIINLGVDLIVIFNLKLSTKKG
jgi:hypothetical protein